MVVNEEKEKISYSKEKPAKTNNNGKKFFRQLLTIISNSFIRKSNKKVTEKIRIYHEDLPMPAKDLDVETETDVGRDGFNYERIINETIDRLNDRIKSCHSFKNEIFDQNPFYAHDNNKNEILGLLDKFIGSSNLLINSKFQQFISLCKANQLQSSEDSGTPQNDDQPQTIPSNQDLTGFFELISLQIVKLDIEYETILKCKANNWILYEKKGHEARKTKLRDAKIKNKTSRSQKPSILREKIREARLAQKKNGMETNFSVQIIV